ncbi:DNA-binding beta-propeller fold protein YncE [Roseateles asaccharophilus]|uniref:DNA-binding beta-propeller fold protein YncE n=2 Tax=Roseateles asaccharophilus TaxID=582607 RepID=A0ABU2A965_9BURK|nr:choice-of-anchor I family protein [Roseateles asaccharophilus]MDR7333027.1 DNA-binding beta-propeller fold protein YncE [Roseateles asaccharophilus]
MKTTRLIQALTASLALASSAHAGLLDGASQAWSSTHTGTPSGFLSEIVSFDAATKTLWVSGVKGVNVLDAKTGASLGFIDTSAWGSINSVAIHNGVAAFAIEANDRKLPGVVQLYDTTSRSLLAGTSTIAVGSLPDMLTFTPDGSRLLVANEGTPNAGDYGTRIGTTTPRNYGVGANDPVGSVSIIDVASRSVVSTATLAGVAQTGSHIRTNTGMDFEPEYIAVNKAGTQAYVSLQEANAMGVLDLQSGKFTKVVGLGAKDFSQAGNAIDTLNNGTVSFQSVAVKGLYMPDGMASFTGGAKTYVVMANEGDFREDDADRSAAGGSDPLLANLRISNTDSSAGNLYAAGARSFSIRDADGNLVYDSGNILDVQAAAAGIYNDGRSRDKGVEPEGVELMEIGGKTFAFIGLERTTTGAVAVFEIDVLDPSKTSFVRMLTMGGQIAPEGLKGFTMDGVHYLAVSAEGADGVGAGTALFALAPVPEPSTYAMLLGGLGLVGWMARRRKA